MVHENLRWNPKMEAKRWAYIRFMHRRGIQLRWDAGVENQANRNLVYLYSRSHACKVDELWVRFACIRIQKAWRRWYKCVGFARRMACRRIQRAWRICNSNPEFTVCRKRLRSEFDGLIGGSTKKSRFTTVDLNWQTNEGLLTRQFRVQGGPCKEMMVNVRK